MMLYNLSIKYFFALFHQKNYIKIKILAKFGQKNYNFKK